MKNKSKHRKMAKQVLGYIAAFPEKHSQDSWIGSFYEVETTKSVCNTTLCAAGTAVFLDGGTEALINAWGGDNLERLNIPTRARKLLGLTSDEGDALFYSGNKTAKKLLKAIAKGNQAKFDSIANW